MTIAVTNAGNVWLAANSAATMPFTAVSGRSLVVILNHETALNGITGLTDSGGNTWVQDYTDTAPGGEGRRVFRCQSIGTVPTTLTCASSTAGTIMYWVFEVTGLNASPYETSYAVTGGSSTTSHSAAFSSAASNDCALVSVIASVDPGTIAPTNSFTEVATTRNGRSGFYKADLSTSGSKTLTYTTSATLTQNHLIAVYKAAVSDPTVSTVSSPTATEGSPLAFLITLSGATNRSTDYVYTLTGTATSADYTSTLTTAMCDNSVTVSGASGSGGTFTVPSGFSSWEVTVPTTSDAIDEADETVVLTLPGSVSGTGTITDDDAAPTISVSDATENAMQVVFTVSLSQASGKSITVDYATADGTKTAGTDYTAASGTLTFAAGETSKTVTVNVL